MNSAPQVIGKEQGKRKRSGGSKGVRMADKKATRVPAFASHLDDEDEFEVETNENQNLSEPEAPEDGDSEDDEEDAEDVSFDEAPLDSAAKLHPKFDPCLKIKNTLFLIG